MLYTSEHTLRSLIPIQPRPDGEDRRLEPEQVAAIQADVRERLAPYLLITRTEDGRQRVEYSIPEPLAGRYIEPLLDLGDAVLAHNLRGRELGKLYTGARFLTAPIDHCGRRVYPSSNERGTYTSVHAVASHVGRIAAVAALATHTLPYNLDGSLSYGPGQELKVAKLTAQHVIDGAEKLYKLPPNDIHTRILGQASQVDVFLAQLTHRPVYSHF